MAAANVSDDLDYETWAPVAKTTLIEKGLWDVVENGVPPDPSKIPELAATLQAEDLSRWRDLAEKDLKALQVLQSSLPDSAFKKTALSASSAKDVWDLLRKGNEQSKLGRVEKQLEELNVDYLMLVEESYGKFTFDEDMWMIYAKSTTNHMTPHEKYFTTLDKTHKAKVGLVDGKFLKVEGRGDVKIMMKEGKKKTFNNVLFVPALNRNVLSLDQMIARGYSVTMEPSFHDRTGAVFGDTVWDERGPALRLQVIEGNEQQQAGREADEIVVEYLMVAPLSKSDLTYDEDLWMVSGHATIHMTPYENVFTTLDRRHKAMVGLADGNVMMVEGKGDVKIVMKDGKKEKTIENVLFVPQISRNVLSLSQMEFKGCSFREGGRGECIISDHVGAVFGDTVWDKKDMALRMHVIKGNLTA